MSGIIAATKSEAWTDGANFENLPAPRVLAFRMAFAKYAHLVRAGERLTATEWNLRILDSQRATKTTKAECEVISQVLGA